MVNKIGVGFISYDSKVVVKDYSFEGSTTPIKVLFVPLNTLNIDRLLQQAKLEAGEQVEVIIKRRSLSPIAIFGGIKAENNDTNGTP